MPLRPGCGLSVSTGPGGDLSSALKVVPMHTVSFWPSLPIHFHLKSQVVHHGLAGKHTLNSMHSGDGVSLCKGSRHSTGACWAPPLHSSRAFSRAGPQVQRVFALSVRGSTALAEKGGAGGFLPFSDTGG